MMTTNRGAFSRRGFGAIAFNPLRVTDLTFIRALRGGQRLRPNRRASMLHHHHRSPSPTTLPDVHQRVAGLGRSSSVGSVSDGL